MPWSRSIIPALLLFVGLWTVAGIVLMPPSPTTVATGGIDTTPIHPNDLAAALVLVLPWLATRALAVAWRGEGSRSPRLLAAFLANGLAVVLATALLVSTGSRGGWAAAAVGGTVAWASLGRRGRGALLLVALVAALCLGWGAARFGADTLVEEAGDALRDHDAEGLTLDHLLSGRLAIWRQAGLVVGDFPLFGSGPHGYEALVPAAYPMPPRSLHEATRSAGPRVDDSHSLYLELAVVHGVPVTIALLALAAVALTRLRRRARRNENPRTDLHNADFHDAGRIHAAGVLGGLAGFLVHGAGDVAALGAVPFGMAVQLGFWLLVAWGLRQGEGTGPRDRIAAATILALAALVILGSAATLSGLVATESSHRRAFQELTDDSAAPDVRLVAELADGPCRSLWWHHRLARDERQALESLRRLAACDPGRLRDLRALAPFDARRARTAWEAAPWHPDALLWRAWSLRSDASNASNASGASSGPPLGLLYDAYLARRSDDGDVWYEAARRLDRGDAWRLAALSQACVHGDPGANGCWGAGRLARRMDLPRPVVLYLLRLSHWKNARDLADEIEAAGEKSAAALTKAPRCPV